MSYSEHTGAFRSTRTSGRKTSKTSNSIRATAVWSSEFRKNVVLRETCIEISVHYLSGAHNNFLIVLIFWFEVCFRTFDVYDRWKRLFHWPSITTDSLYLSPRCDDFMAWMNVVKLPVCWFPSMVYFINRELYIIRPCKILWVFLRFKRIWIQIPHRIILLVFLLKSTNHARKLGNIRYY